MLELHRERYMLQTLLAQGLLFGWLSKAQYLASQDLILRIAYED